MKKREIRIKPSCMHEWLAFPAAQGHLFTEKINFLVDNPIPDGKLKKKLKGYDGLYRLRVGDYRVFYSFGDTWVVIHGIRKRDERTFDDRITGLDVSAPQPAGPAIEYDLDAVEQSPAPAKTFSLRNEPKPLPGPLTAEWLRALRVPAAAIPVLLACKTDEEVLTAPVPYDVMGRVMDNLFPKPLSELQTQPEFVVPSAEDLIRYKEGSLIAFLLKLDPEQQKAARATLKGPAMLRGGAGTGKSTIALYRVKEVLEADPKATVLFTTYTNALIAASEQLLAGLLSNEQLRRVRVSSCDQIVYDIVSRFRKIRAFEDDHGLKRIGRLLESFEPGGESAFERRARKQMLNNVGERYLVEEFDWVLAGRGLNSLAEYQAAPRPGRGHAFHPGLRGAVWDLYQTFSHDIKKAGVERWPQLRLEALDLVEKRRYVERYNHVVIDEAQDLSPAALSLMAELATTEAGLFLAADSKQSLYSRNYTWTHAHPRLQFRGRTQVLRRNYRSTIEIEKAAFDVLRAEEGEGIESSDGLHTGPMPVLLTLNTKQDEGQWAARFIRQMSRHLHVKLSSAAVLVPTASIGERIAAEITKHDVPAAFFAGRDLDLNAERVKVLTLHSAKGLEFPVVVLCGFEDGTYPVPEEFAEPDAYQERMRNERRLLYVGLTRAMRGLMVTRPQACRHEALNALTPASWAIEAAS